MNRKQQLATGALALVIVGSVALMPVSAEHKAAKAAATASVRQAGFLATAPAAARELPHEKVRDLTYN
jgi:hypothetical protein